MRYLVEDQSQVDVERRRVYGREIQGVYHFYGLFTCFEKHKLRVGCEVWY